jgi:hypothetical protein
VTYKPGQSGNPAGRKPLKKILRNVPPKFAKDFKAIDLVASIAQYDAVPLQQRAAAAMFVASYQELKPSERTIEDLQLPKPTSVAIATENIAEIAHAVTSGKLSPDMAPKVIAPQKDFIDAVVGSNLEQRLAALEQAAERNPLMVKTVVLGGLPKLPGTAITMPELGSPSSDGHSNVREFKIERNVPLPDDENKP